MVDRSMSAHGPRTARRGRVAAAVAAVSVLAVGVVIFVVRGTAVAPSLSPVVPSTVAAPGEVLIVVRDDDGRRQSDLTALLEGLVKPNLAAGVEVRGSGISQHSVSSFGKVVHTGERRLMLGANDPSTVIGPWFDFDAFVENANFLSRTLFEQIDTSAIFDCSVEHTPMGGGARQVSRVVRVDRELQFEVPHDEP
jgi:hypothetical protein